MVLGKLLENTIENKLHKIENILSENFQLALSSPKDLNEMQTVLDNIRKRKNKIVMESNFNDYINNTTYNILNLAEEALILKMQIEGQNEKIK